MKTLRFIFVALMTLFSVNSFSQEHYTAVVNGMVFDTTINLSVGDFIDVKSGDNGAPFDYYVYGIQFSNIPSNSLITSIEVTYQMPTSFVIEVTSSTQALYKDITVNVSTAGIDENNVNYNVYPNPTTDFINIDGVDVISVKVFDMSGKLMISENSTKLDVSYLPNGYYTLLINDVSRVKFIKN